MSDLARFSSSLSDRYRIESELGRGGMAVVYLAHDRRQDRRVAVKVLHAELASTLGADRFLREIAITGKLVHSHILPLLESGEVEGLLYYVMPYVEGETLRERLRREGQLPLEEAVRIAQAVASGVAYAHGQGVIHRDIKPENIFLVAGQAVLGDFGIARAIGQAGGERLTETGLTVGTPAYMSPEQAMGAEQVDERSDVYAVGCVLYEMLGGGPPFTGTTPQAILARKVTDTVPSLRAVRETVSPALENVVLTALARSPADRFATATALVEALEQPGTVPPIPVVAAPPGGRSKVWWLGMGVVGVVLAGLVVGGGWQLWRGGATALVANRVVVLPFANRTGGEAGSGLGEIAARAITEELSALELVEPVATSEVVPLVRPEGSEAGAAPAVAVARRTAAALVVTGSYYAYGDSLEFRAEVLDVRDGSIVEVAQPVRVEAAAARAGIDAMSGDLAGAVASYVDPIFAQAGLKSGQRPNIHAYREFVEGIRHLSRSELDNAVSRFGAAWAEDTTFLAALVYEAQSPTLARADSLRAMLETRRDRLSDVQRAYLDLLELSIKGDLRAKHALARRRLEQTPNERNRFYVAYTALDLNLAHEALEMFASIDSSLYGSQDWRKLAEVYHALGRYEDELQAAREGVKRFADRSNVTGAEIFALAALGRADDVERRLAGLRSQSHRTPWSGNLDTEYYHAARICKAHGHVECGDRLLRELLAELEGRLPSEPANVRFHLARVYLAAGRPEDAAPLLRAVAAEQPDFPLWYVGGLLGIAEAKMGNREAALVQEERLRGVGHPAWGPASSFYVRSGIFAHLGERERALDLLRRAFDEGMAYYPYAQKHYLATEPLWGDPEFETIFAPKR